MRCVIVVPVHGRDALTNIWLRHMEYVRLMCDGEWTLLTVGDRSSSGFAFSSTHLNQPNEPLSLKVQAGLLYSRCYDPDLVMTTGSDDFPDADLLMSLQSRIASGVHYASISDMYMWDTANGYGYYWPGYKERLGHGSFRTFSKELLDSVDWTLWTRHANHGLDGMMDQRLADITHRKEVIALSGNGHLVSVKTPNCMNTIKAMNERYQMRPAHRVLDPLGETEQEIRKWSKVSKSGHTPPTATTAS